MRSSGIKKLVLLGAGHAHLQVLAQLAQNRPADLDITVVSPFALHLCGAMAPGLVAGHYSAEDGQIPLEPLIKAAGAKWHHARCSGVDAGEQTVRLSAAAQSKSPSQNLPTNVPYHLLSIDTVAAIDRERLEADMPGAATHALTVRPIEVFATLWPKVVALAKEQPVSIAAVGAGASGIELLFAAEECLRKAGVVGARFTLITGGGEVAANCPPGVRQRVLRQLKQRGITVLRDACVGMEKGQVLLRSGAQLACDVPLIANGTHAPAWLRGSGLALSESGHALVNAFQQSTSHPNVFAAGDVSARADQPHALSGAHATRAGASLAHNLLSFHEGKALKPHRPPGNTLNLLSCGSGHAIAYWGPFSAEGAWAWRWKDKIDRAFVAKYRMGNAV